MTGGWNQKMSSVEDFSIDGADFQAPSIIIIIIIIIAGGIKCVNGELGN
jgi:hypothetical protein